MNDRHDRMLWIGGSPCSGKSTVAQRLAQTFGLRVFSCNDAFERHRLLVTPERQPVFSRLASLECDELWCGKTEHDAEETRVAEGAALLPSLLADLGVPPARAIWIVPAEPFQRTHYARREWRHDVLRACSDPEQAWENWMARDAGLARRVAADAQLRGTR